MKKLLLTCALFAMPFLSALAADNPWIGTWKLDLAKSHFTGETFTYSKSANGLMHYSDGSTISYDFGIDGREYKAAYNRTTTWSVAGDNAWNSVTKADDNVLVNVHRELSADGKTLTITATGTRPDGSAIKNVTVYTRVTGTKGLVGKWRSTKVEISAPVTVVISNPSLGMWRWEFPGLKNSYEGKADGTDLPVTGPIAPPGWTMSLKVVSPTKLSWVSKVNGKPSGYGNYILAADGKSYTNVAWDPGKLAEKSTGVYIRQ